MIHKIMQTASALVFSALVPALIFSALSANFKLFSAAFIVALGHSILLGLPCYLAIKRKSQLNWIISMSFGFVIGWIPMALFMWPYSPGENFNSWIGETQTIVNGIPTALGWIEYFKSTVVYGILGATGGLFFWLTLSFYSKLLNNQGKRFLTYLIPLFALIICVAIYAFPSITADRSCHNPLREGGTSISPKVGVDVDIPYEEWPVLIELFSNFALNNNLEFKNSSENRPGSVRSLYLSICHESGFVISIVEQRWPHNNYANMIPGRGIGISTYEMGKNTSWKEVKNNLLYEIQNQWPGKINYRDSRGNKISKDETPLSQ
tara:strand:+ start:340 stop:1302 length:963 start_codon:yes stop_codon:yes gene_type:complete